MIAARSPLRTSTFVAKNSLVREIFGIFRRNVPPSLQQHNHRQPIHAAHQIERLCACARFVAGQRLYQRIARVGKLASHLMAHRG